MRKNKLTILLLASIILGFTFQSLMFLPSVHGEYAGTVTSYYSTSTPVLDGVIDATEWADANVYVNVGWDDRFDVYFMHGEDHFYIGIVFFDTTEHPEDFVVIYFDEGDDREHGSGSGDGVLNDEQEDAKYVFWDGTLADGYWSADENDFKNTFGPPEAINFEAAMNYHTDHWEAEFKIPFEGNDGQEEDKSDLYLIEEDTCGILVIFRDGQTGQRLPYPEYERASYRNGFNPDNYLALEFGAYPDVTNPTISDLTPSDGSEVDTARPTISASLSDDHSGVDANSVSITVDGSDVTSDATVTPTTVSYTPSSDLSEGTVTVTLEVSDNSGNTATTAWTFTVKLPAPAIPGFPLEGIIVGLAAAAVTVYLLRRRMGQGVPVAPQI